MEGLYQNKYRVKSTRLPGWDYGADAYYFITICVYERVECLGRIVTDNDGIARIELSPIGKIMKYELAQTKKIRRNVFIDISQIMPNHVHVIFRIDNEHNNSDMRGVSHGRDVACNVSTVGWI